MATSPLLGNVIVMPGIMGQIQAPCKRLTSVPQRLDSSASFSYEVKQRNIAMNWFKSLWKAAPAPLAPGEHDPMLYNFTPRAQQTLALARMEADRFKHNFVGTEHVLLGLIKLGQGTAVGVLKKMGID